MNTLAIIFSYKRPAILEKCIESLFTQSKFFPKSVVIIDDGSGTDVLDVLQKAEEKFAGITLVKKDTNKGFSDSAKIGLEITRNHNPDYAFWIESDYVFQPSGLDLVMDCFINTDYGRAAVAIAGCNHPNYRWPQMHQSIFPDCMKMQVGEDNVNRAGLYRPFHVETSQHKFCLERVSNNCWTTYFNWKLLCQVEEQQPEFTELLNQACSPIDNPNYPTSGQYKSQKTVDDGMLSHAVSLCWNRWAVKNNICRNRFSAWLNIATPEVAIHHAEGGMHH
jgi:glycosyltransferase involved in cell wall biosynthesis